MTDKTEGGQTDVSDNTEALSELELLWQEINYTDPGEYDKPWERLVQAHKAVVRALERQREGCSIQAKPIAWEHKEYPSGAQEWFAPGYGFFIEYDRLEDPEFQYRAEWGEADSEHFPTLSEAQSWCQEQVDSLVQEWAMLASAPEPGD